MKNEIDLLYTGPSPGSQHSLDLYSDQHPNWSKYSRNSPFYWHLRLQGLLIAVLWWLKCQSKVSRKKDSLPANAKTVVYM